MAELMLLLAALAWGVSFPVAKDAMLRWPHHKLFFLSGRFWIALAVLAPFGLALPLKHLARHVVPGVITAGALLTVFLFQFEALRLPSTSGEVAFVTSVSSVMVPVALWVFLRRKVQAGVWGGFVTVTLGIYFLLVKAGTMVSVSPAGLLSLTGAAGFAAYIILTDHFRKVRTASGHPVYQVIPLLIVQFGTIAVTTGVLSRFVELPVWSWPEWNRHVVFDMSFMAIIATGLTLFIQTRFQASTAPEHVALIFTTEPVFAGIFGWWLLNERFTLRMTGGAALILAGVMVAELAAARAVARKDGATVAAGT